MISEGPYINCSATLRVQPSSDRKLYLNNDHPGRICFFVRNYIRFWAGASGASGASGVLSPSSAFRSLSIVRSTPVHMDESHVTGEGLGTSKLQNLFLNK